MGNIGEAFKGLFIVLLVMFPLAIWKVIDIALWVYKHFEVKFL